MTLFKNIPIAAKAFLGFAIVLVLLGRDQRGWCDRPERDQRQFLKLSPA